MIKTPLTAEPSLIDFYNEPKADNLELKLEFQKCKRFGVSYMGSKNKIVKALIPQLPSAKYFVDLFAGGCAMTHGAMLSGKYERFIANDIGDAPSLFLRAIKGEFKDEKRWISRDDFFALKDKDPYVRYIWSFGNNGKGYLYSKEIEPYKKAYHYAKIFGDFSLFNQFAPYIEQENGGNLRKYIKDNYERIKKDYMNWFYSQLEYSPDEVESMLNATQADYDAEAERIRTYLKNALNQSGKTQADINRYLGNQMVRHYFAKSQWCLPTKEAYEKLQEILPLNKPYSEVSKIILGIRYKLQSLYSLEILQSLYSLERLQNLQSLERLERLEVYQGCYKELKLPKPNECVIYCDPPYINSEGYYKQSLKNGKTSFDHGEFYDYVESLARQGYKVFISEYWMPPERFKSVFNVDKRQLLNGLGAGAIKQEHLFVPII